MAYREGRGWFKLVVILAVVWLGWKYGAPWAREHVSTFGRQKSNASPSDKCIEYAAEASEKWGSGLAHFVNPPYDLSAWDSFKSDIDSRIDDHQTHCDCQAEACTKARDAMNSLSSLVSDLDASIRHGSPPPEDVVRRQERIDNMINDARNLAAAGK